MLRLFDCIGTDPADHTQRNIEQVIAKTDPTGLLRLQAAVLILVQGKEPLLLPGFVLLHMIYPLNTTSYMTLYAVTHKQY